MVQQAHGDDLKPKRLARVYLRNGVTFAVSHPWQELQFGIIARGWWDVEQMAHVREFIPWSAIDHIHLLETDAEALSWPGAITT